MVLVNQACPVVAGPSRNINRVGILEDDESDEIYLEVSVTNPVTRKLADGEFVTFYGILIETNDTAFTMSKSMVRRRYSDFVTLRSILQDQHPNLSVPKLPGRTILGKRFDQRFVDERCRGLQQFLRSIMEQPIYLSNKSLHLFVQTELSMKQIQDVVDGMDSYELPHNKTEVLILRPCDGNKNAGSPSSILKGRDSCNSLVSCVGECRVKTKHEHIRVGSGIVVCPFLVTRTNGVASSAPFNITPKMGSPGWCLRSCASDTCLDGANGSPFAGSKKRVSFFLSKDDKDNENCLMKAVEEVHNSVEVSQELAN